MDEKIQLVTMPKWGLSMKTGKITEWVVSEGDEISSGDDLVEIDTDKIAGSLESSWEGVLRKIVAETGTDAPVGATIAIVAPAEVPDSEIEAIAEEAREKLASGAFEEEDEGPEVGTVEVDGRQIAYATVTDGSEGAADEVVVLVHGYGGDKNSWLFVQEPMSQGRTVHAIDLPGHGTSTKDVGDGSVRTLAAAVLGFLDAKGISSAHLVGHSLGGAVVTEAAAGAPDKVRSLTLVSPAGFSKQADAEYLRGFAAAGSRRELKPHLGKLFADPGQVTRQLADDLMKYKRLDGVQQALDTLLGTLLDGDEQAIDATGQLAGVQVPVAVVWGADDVVIPPAGKDALGVEPTVVDGAGHMVHMEKPSAVSTAVQGVTG